MREQVLRDFFAGQATAAELARDVKGSVDRTTTAGGSVISRVRITNMAGEFPLETRHLLRLLDAVEGGELTLDALDAVCFCIEASTHSSGAPTSRGATASE